MPILVCSRRGANSEFRCPAPDWENFLASERKKKEGPAGAEPSLRSRVPGRNFFLASLSPQPCEVGTLTPNLHIHHTFKVDK